MKLTKLRTFIVGNPQPGVGGRYFIFVKLTTDHNVHGVGEAYCLPFHPKVVTGMLEDVFERYFLEQDPHDIESIWRRVYSAGYTQHPDLSLMAVLSALEMACWDIIGKEAGQPVYKLLGGRVHERLRAYTYIYARPGDKTDVYQDPDLSAERAAEYVAQGFTAIKFDPAGPYTAFDGRQLSLDALALCERFMRQLREAVGTRADLLFGTHGQMTAAGAILQMNLGRVGGILEAKKIAALAEVDHVQLAPHLYCGPVVGAANIQLATCSPNFLILEGIERWQGFHAQVLVKPIRWEAGYVIPPTEPGLGVELNETVIGQHPYHGDRLHLEMAGKPVG